MFLLTTMKSRLLLSLFLVPLSCYVDLDGPSRPMQPVIPEHHQVFALFMEQPTIDFIISLGSEELEAIKQAKLDGKEKHLSDEEFAEVVGNYSAVAKGQFKMLVAENKELEKHLIGNARNVIHEMDDGLKDMDEQFTREDLKRWLVEVVQKLNALSTVERDSIVKSLPHKGLLLSYTGLLGIKNMNDAEKYVRDLMTLYGQYENNVE